MYIVVNCSATPWYYGIPTNPPSIKCNKQNLNNKSISVKTKIIVFEGIIS